MNAPISLSGPPVKDGFEPLDPALLPDVSKLVTEDDTPVDGLFSEKQMRLLTEPLYSTWVGPGGGVPFRVHANVGLYHVPQDPLVPDVMLGLGVTIPAEIMEKGNRSWCVWIVGQSPDLVLEIVSNQIGGEDTTKLVKYATMGIPYYVIHDPENLLGQGVLRGFVLHARKYVPVDPRWLPDIGLGLVLWQGVFEDFEYQWLRWCDEQGRVIPTGLEKAKAAESARESAERARQLAEKRAQQLAAKLRELGYDVPQ